MKKDLGKLARLARRQGWTVDQVKSGHTKWRSPAGELVVSSTSPSGPGSLLSLKRDLRRAGLSLP
jgi:hypothetical protein